MSYIEKICDGKSGPFEFERKFFGISFKFEYWINMGR